MPASAQITVDVSGATKITDYPLGVTLDKDTGCTAEVTNVKSYSESQSIYLEAVGTAGNEARITILTPGLTLGELDTISWMIYALAGYPAHIDITLDTTDSLQSMLTAELAVNNPAYSPPTYGTYNAWLKTFEMSSGDGYGVIDDATVFWVTKLGAGDQDAPSSTLGNWKIGVVDSDPFTELLTTEIGSSTEILKIEIEVDNWIVDSKAYIDDVKVNGVLYHFETKGVDKGDELTVSGTGVTAGSVVNVYWDAVNSGGLKNSTEANPDGSYECTFDVPSDVAGEHWIWVKDLDTVTTKRYDYPIYVLPKLSMSPSSGLPGDKITITGYGFSSVADVIITSAMTPFSTTPVTPETDELGYFTASFTVPDSLDYTSYPVTATDEKGYTATEDFTVGACISLDVAAGPVGSVVEISGEGFYYSATPEDSDAIEDTEVRITGGTIPVTCTIVDYTDPIAVKPDGSFKFEIVIPQVDMDDYDTIEVLYEAVSPDDNTWTSADFEVTGEAEIELDPQFGVQGTTVSIEGFNFIQISGKEIEIVLCGYTAPYAKIQDITTDIETDSDGEFADTFVIPAKSSGQYKIKARSEEYNIEAYASFRIGLMIVIPTPSSGATGTEVVLSGTGFTGGKDWNATFGEITIFETGDGEITGSDLMIGDDVPTFYVPTVDPGTYTISVLDIDSGITVDVDWTVTATSMVEFDPVEAPNEYEVSISGSYFAASEDGGLDFVLYNVTDTGETDNEWDITSDVDPDPDADWLFTTLDEDGNFAVLWTVDESGVLSIGDYILNVTDFDGLFAQAHFSVVEKSINVEPRKPSFARGETVAFDIESTFTQHNSYIEIYDPAGDLYWTTDLMTDGTLEGAEDTVDMWLKVGMIQTVPYYYQTAGGNQLLLLEDATLGTWSWEWYDFDDEELASGTFTVTAAPADVISSQLTQLNADLAQLSTDFASVSTDVNSLSTSVAALSDNLAQTIAAVNANSNAVQDVAAAVASVADTASNAVDAANAAAAAATSAKDAADSAGASASGLTNLVYGAIVAALVAALAAIVSLMQISRRIAG